MSDMVVSSILNSKAKITVRIQRDCRLHGSTHRVTAHVVRPDDLLDELVLHKRAAPVVP